MQAEREIYELDRAADAHVPGHGSLNGSQREYLAMVAHDLRSPAGSAVGLLTLASERWEDLGDWERKELVRRATAACEMTIEMLEDFFKLSALQAGRFTIDMRPFRLDALTRRLVHQRAVVEDGCRIDLSMSPRLPRAFGDPHRHTQILTNLINNAAKFSNEIIDVEIAEDADRLIVSVRDRGVGIEPEDMDRIFEPFTMIENRGDGTGSGLGLAICKQLVERQGGRIWLESEPNVGTTFRYTVPIAAE